jgi:glycosyltransferase involved in cell wall biosynthesis
MLQAMSCGLPVVSTAVGGIPEVVRDGVDGILCGVDDVASFTAGLRRLSEDALARDRMGRSARERILAGYSLDHCLDGLLATYERARSCAH